VSRAYWDGSHSDSLVIDIPEAQKSNEVYGTSPVEGIESFNGDVVGQSVCQSAIVSHYTCGILQSKNVTVCYDGRCFDLQRQASFNVAQGDSGAPVISPNISPDNYRIAKGILAALSGPNTAYYGQIWEIDNVHGVSPCVTLSCS